MKYISTIAAASALFSFVSAHGGVVEYSFNGEIYAGYNPGRSSIKRRTKSWVEGRASSQIQREWDSWDPVSGGIGSTATICNDPGSPATAYATIAAGGTVSACYNDPWAHNSGPLTVYMAACPGDDCTTVATTDLDSLKWFAIYKEGLVDGKWATEAYMESNSNCITHIIPETLKAGNYLIRHETINLAKVEFYANCANVKVTGAGTETPADSFLATISEIYQDGDPSLEPIDSTPDSYTIPGPNVWPDDTAEGGQIFEVSGIKNPCSGQSQGSGGECADGGDDTTNPTPPNPQATGSSNSSSSSTSSSSSSAASSSSSDSSDDSSSSSDSSDDSSSSDSTDSTSSSKATPSGSATSSGSGSAAAYAQCGGGGVATATCAEGYTCFKYNEYYSQCLPE